MWLVTHIHSGNKVYLLSDRGYTIGRVGSDIVLTDDTSISRSHAHFKVSTESLELEDKGSKYGTYHNEHIERKQKLLKGKSIELKEGDRILFGALKNEWIVSKHNINTMVSSLNPNDLVEVRKHLNILGGHIISTWESKCTHLTMSEITITIKVLHALIEKIPIVSCDYWKDSIKNIQNKQEPPNPSCYLPKRSNQLSSAILDEHLAFNESRKTLFAGKTFVFMTKKHFDIYSPIIVKAGGQCKDLKNNVSKTFLIRKDTIVVQYVASTQSQGSQTINTISEYLESKSLRTIPEYEIGLAIVCCNTRKYCNPSFNTITNIFPESAGDTPNIGTMLAENTSSQKSQINSLNFSNSEIPESSDYLKSAKKPVTTAAPVRSEVYDSEIITIESQNSLDCMSSMVPESDTGCKSKEHEEISHKDIPSLRNVDFSDDDFSENLVMSSDIVSSETSQLNAAKKRPITPVETCSVTSKKPRISTPPRDESQEPNISLATSNRNGSHSRPVLPGFLQKSQIINTQEIEEPPNRSIAAPVKRGRIALITDNDSDDNDDDIFNFGSSNKKPKTSEQEKCNSDEEELFAFGNKSPRNEIDRAAVERVNNSETSLPKTQPFVPNKKSLSSTRIKVSPIKASPDGWLSALSILKIKDDDDEIKDEKNSSGEDLKRKEWIDSLKDGFEVRVRKMNLISRGCNSSVSTHEMPDASLNSTRKNFKAFVKKHNYKSQRLVIPTFKTVVLPTT